MNLITIELCTEDRERLDRLATALEVRTASLNGHVAEGIVRRMKEEAIPEVAKTLTQETETPAPNTPTKEENPKEANSVTLEQIQQKVVQLAAGFGGAKKAAVREVVNAYAKKVSDLPENTWEDVWNKLIALEKEA